jgi:hypothetical protein
MRLSTDSRTFMYYDADKYSVDGSNSSNALPKSQYRAVMAGLGSAAQQGGDRQPSYMASLPPHLKQDMRLVSGIAGVCEALDVLSQIPSMWPTKSFGWLNDIRKSWCDEVCACQSNPNT